MAAISSRTAGSRRFPQFGGTWKFEVSPMLMMLLETVIHNRNKMGNFCAVTSTSKLPIIFISWTVEFTAVRVGIIHDRSNTRKIQITL